MEEEICESCGKPSETLTPVLRWGNICPDCCQSVKAVIPEKEPVAPAQWDPFHEFD